LPPPPPAAQPTPTWAPRGPPHTPPPPPAGPPDWGAPGPGTHHLVCSVTTDGAPLTSALHIDNSRDEELRLGEADALVLTTVLAAGLATGAPGGVVMRSIRPGARDTVRGWALHDGWLRPLTEAEVFNAYCTDAATGEPVAPEPGVDHRAGIHIAQTD
ncbi:hypothetical protein ACFW9F_16780, partial [Streptomyces sp. NPDC059506]